MAFVVVGVPEKTHFEQSIRVYGTGGGGVNPIYENPNTHLKQKNGANGNVFIVQRF